MRFAMFRLHLSKLLRLPRKSDTRLYEVLRLSRKIISANLKIWCSKMQPLSGNQRPDLLTALMNMSLVLRLPRKMHLCRSSSNVPRLPKRNATQPSRFAHSWQGAQSRAPATRNYIWTSKSGPSMWCFVPFDFEMCFAPQRRALFRHLSFQKCSERKVFCAFWLRNVLGATTPCTFSTSQLLKVLRSWGVCTFWLGNVLYATTACNFSSLIWPACSAPAALESLLFDPPEPQIIGKTVFRDFPTFSGIWIFFLLRLSLFWSSFFFAPLLCLFPSLLFICPYCRKFDF